MDTKNARRALLSIVQQQRTARIDRYGVMPDAFDVARFMLVEAALDVNHTQLGASDLLGMSPRAMAYWVKKLEIIHESHKRKRR